MKLYTDLKIPLWNWNEIQESQINGSIDLRYLVKESDYETPVKTSNELYETYLNILYQIPGLNIDLNTSWTNYLIERQIWQVITTQNQYAKIIGKKEKEISYNKLERAFIDYLTNLDSNYNGFSFTVYSLRKDFKEVWDYDHEIPKELIDNKKMNFFLFEEFIDMIKDWTFFRALILSNKLNEFVEKYIESDVKKFKSVRKVYDTLYTRFRDMNQIEKLRIIRDDYFSIYKLKFETDKKNDIIDQVIALREINNQDIPMSKDNSITLEEFLKQVNRAKIKEAAKKKK